MNELTKQELKELLKLVKDSLNDNPHFEKQAARLRLIEYKLETIINKG